jgi:hypothetical protein
MLVQQKSGKTNVKIAADALSRHIAEGFLVAAATGGKAETKEAGRRR